ncbi:MAG: CAP domain-containing protein, partial [Cyanobacteria bacterium P01_F01_bin.143]
YEQYMLELVNRARSNPNGEAGRYGLNNLNRGLSSGTITSAAKQPLAFNFSLIDAARDHSQWISDANTFSHTGAGGSSPGDRMAAAGYDFTGAWRWGENIAWQGTTGTPNITSFVRDEHESLFLSDGHRKNILNSGFREIGIGVIQDTFATSTRTYNAVITTQKFASSGSSVFLTGVAFNDLVIEDDFYTIGEGLSGIEVKATRRSDNQSFTTHTWDAGGYQIALEAGTYDVTFSENGTIIGNSYPVAIASQNVKLDLDTSNIEIINYDDLLRGGKDQDTLNGGKGDDTLYGLGENDKLVGGDGNDSLYGSIGNDRLYGQNNDDKLVGGDGNDSLYGGNGDDKLNGGKGDDSVYGQNDDDRLFGGDGNDLLNGGTGDDSVYGQNDDDKLVGGDGNDSLYGGIGDDSVYGQNNDDKLLGGDGNDYLSGSTGNDSLYGQDDYDKLLGGDGNDYLSGGNDADELLGQNNNDKLVGGNGDDTLNGGLGLDSLKGGAGSDRFVLLSATTADRDIIEDFRDGVDGLVLSGNLSFGNLAIFNDSAISSTVIEDNRTNAVIAVLSGVDASLITEADFS